MYQQNQSADRVEQRMERMTDCEYLEQLAREVRRVALRIVRADKAANQAETGTNDRAA